jgi:hypothetical protein
MSAFIVAFLIFAVLVIAGVMLLHAKKAGQVGVKEEEKPDVEYVCTRCNELDCDCSKRDRDPEA